MMSIHVVAGADLLPESADGLSNPYVILDYAQHELQTDFVAKTLDPVWDARFEVPVKDDATIRIWLFSSSCDKADALLGIVDVVVDVPAAKAGRFSLPASWVPVQPIELSAQEKLKNVHNSSTRRLSATFGNRGRFADGSWYIFSDGNRHLFTHYEKREKNLGQIQIEITPCRSEEDEASGGMDQGCGCFSSLSSCNMSPERPKEFAPADAGPPVRP